MKIKKKHFYAVIISSFLATNFFMQAPEIIESTNENVHLDRDSGERQKKSKFAWIKRNISEHFVRIRNRIASKFTSSTVARSEPIKSSVLFDPIKERESRTFFVAKSGPRESREDTVVNSDEFIIRHRVVEKIPAVKDPRKDLMRADIVSLVSDLDAIRLEMREISPVQLMKRDEVRRMLTILDLNPDEITEEIESMTTLERQKAMVDHLFQPKGLVAHSIESLALIRDFFSNSYYLPRIEEKLFEYLNDYRRYAEIDKSKQPLSNMALKYLIRRTMIRLQRIMESHDPAVLDQFSQKDWDYATGGISKKERQEMEQMG